MTESKPPFAERIKGKELPVLKAILHNPNLREDRKPIIKAEIARLVAEHAAEDREAEGAFREGLLTQAEIIAASAARQVVKESVPRVLIMAALIAVVVTMATELMLWALDAICDSLNS